MAGCCDLEAADWERARVKREDTLLSRQADAYRELQEERPVWPIDADLIVSPYGLVSSRLG